MKHTIVDMIYLQFFIHVGNTRIHIEIILFQIYTYVTSQTYVNNHQKIQWECSSISDDKASLVLKQVPIIPSPF
jgi:hypothetical protein